MAAEKESLVVGTKVKKYLKDKDLMSSSDILDALNEQVYAILNRAAERAEQNGRKTVQARDV
ncbi:MAG: hypothetical protein J7M08_00130 [Planctomycetes bacterium]|nr:hypothetical protein [Planctomycetota bacterium]